LRISFQEANAHIITVQAVSLRLLSEVMGVSFCPNEPSTDICSFPNTYSIPAVACYYHNFEVIEKDRIACRYLMSELVCCIERRVAPIRAN
jgi:hypothetical protein